MQSRRCEHGLLPAVANELVWHLSYPLSCWDMPLLSMASWEVAWDPGILHPNQNSLDCWNYPSQERITLLPKAQEGDHPSSVSSSSAPFPPGQEPCPVQSIWAYRMRAHA